MHKWEEDLTHIQAAMAELLAKNNHPTDPLVDAYEQWSDGGWGSILTGKVGRCHGS
jgi:2,4-dienoyl-CoA reductase-like NADH-dependent reductase (Old Yellow Enzyme family)